MTSAETKVRYHVEYLDMAKGDELMLARRQEDDGNPGLWDYVDQDEIIVRKPFETKDAAFGWANLNAELDVFNMPRVREQTLTLHTTDDRGRLVKPWLSWDQTGYWDVDGTDIEEAA